MTNIDDWLDMAVSGIGFYVDRDEARKELKDHIEDKTADLMRIFPDMTETEAQKRTLAGMGDAEEVKVSLAKVHKSWLGRLWALACFIYALTALITALFLPVLLLSLGFGMMDWEGRLSILGAPETAWGQEVLDRSVVLMPDGEEIVSDGCRLTMERAWLVEDPEKGWMVQAELLVRDLDLWVNEYNFVYRMSAVDGAGNRYSGGLPYDWERTQYTVCRRSPVNPPMLTNPFAHRYILSVYGVDPDMKELRLDYDWLGRSFSMTVRREEAGL